MVRKMKVTRAHSDFMQLGCTMKEPYRIKAMNGKHLCSTMFKFGSIVTTYWIRRHYVTEITNKPKLKLKDMIIDIKQKYICLVSIRQFRREKL